MTAPPALLALAPISARRVEIQSIKTLIIFGLLVIGFRLLGKREVTQLNVYDLAMLMALSNGVQNAMTGGLGNLSIGLATSTTVLIAAWLVSRFLIHRPRLEERFVGVPTLLVHDGKVLSRGMRKQRVSNAELAEALRQHGLDDPRDAKLVILEVDGSVSVIPKTHLEKPKRRQRRRRR